MMGYELHAYSPLGKTFLPNLEKWLSDLSSTRDNAMAAHQVAQQKMKEQIASKFTPWKVGEKVWLEMTNLHMGGPKKLQMKRTSPFEIKEVISWTTFCLCIPSRWRIHPVFHTSLLTTYKETTEQGPNFLQPPPNLIYGEEEYKVKAVIGHQGKPGWQTFQIWWKGYSAVEDTWCYNSFPLLFYSLDYPLSSLSYLER